MANNQRDPGREAVWRGVLKRWAASGLSVREFCRREGLGESNFYAWRRTIAQRDGEQDGTRQRTTSRRDGKHKRSAQRNGRAKRPKKVPAFVPVVVTDEPQRESGFVIELACGRRLLLPEAIAIDRLAAVVHALEAGPASAGAGR